MKSHTKLMWHLYFICLHYIRGPRSAVGITTGYGLDSPGIESRRGWDFPHLSRPALGPTPPPVPWVPGLSRGVKNGRGMTLKPTPSSPGSKKCRAITVGAWLWNQPLLVPGQKRVELYLYSAYGPYGLYRASVPVQGCTLPYNIMMVD